MLFKYCVELKKGYKENASEEENTEAFFTIEADNRVTADRIANAMLLENPNIITYDCDSVCIKPNREDFDIGER